VSRTTPFKQKVGLKLKLDCPIADVRGRQVRVAPDETAGGREGEVGGFFDEIQNLVGPTEPRTRDSPAGPQRGRVSRMRRTPANGGAGWTAAEQDSAASRPERRSRARAPDSPWEGEHRGELHAANAAIRRGGRSAAKQERSVSGANGPTHRRIRDVRPLASCPRFLRLHDQRSPSSRTRRMRPSGRSGNRRNPR
jgi:hypothetical protein